MNGVLVLVAKASKVSETGQAQSVALTAPLPKNATKAVTNIVQKAVSNILQNNTITISGGSKIVVDDSQVSATTSLIQQIQNIIEATIPNDNTTDDLNKNVAITNNNAQTINLIKEYSKATTEERSTFVTQVIARSTPVAGPTDPAISQVSQIVGSAVSTISAINIADNNINTRLASLGYASGSRSPMVVGLWIQTMTSKNSQDQDGSIAAFRGSTYAVTSGIDFEVNDSNIFGAAFTYANSELKMKSATQNKSTFNPKLLSLYSSNTIGKYAFFRSRLDMAFTDAENTGTGVFSYQNKELKSKYHTKYFGASAVFGVNIPVAHKIYIAPMMGINYRYLAGYIYNQKLQDKAVLQKEFGSKGVMSVSGGVYSCYIISGENYDFVPEATLVYNYDLDIQGQTMTISGDGVQVPIVIDGSQDSTHWSMNASVGATMKYEMFDVGVNGFYTGKGKYMSYGGALKLRIKL